MDRSSISQSGDVVTITLEGEVDLADVGDLGSVAQRALAADNVKQIIVDLAAVTFLDSTALGALVGLRNDADRATVALAVRNLRPHISRLFAVTGLDAVFSIENPTTAPQPQRG